MKKINKNNLILGTGLSLLSCIFLCHCGDDTTANMNARDLRRAHTRQQFFENQNKEIVGVYKGSTPTADIFLTVELSSISGGSSIDGPSPIPTSTLAGSLIVSPKLEISSNNEKVQFAFPFSIGSFDPEGASGGRLSLQTTETNGAIENLNCDADTRRVLTCLWTVGSNTKNTKFILKPTNPASLDQLSVENSADMVYTGHNNDLNVMIEFDSSFVSNEGSQVPQLTILGHMIFFARSDSENLPAPTESQAKFGFKKGTYDIFTGRLSLTMDDDSQETLDCRILKSGQSLNCIWNARVKQVFTVTKTVRR